MFNYLVVIPILLATLSGCAGLGLDKRATVMPDEIWVTGETLTNEEDSGKIVGGLKWKLQ